MAPEAQFSRDGAVLIGLFRQSRRRPPRRPARSTTFRVNVRAISLVMIDDRGRAARQRDVEPSPRQDLLISAHYGRLQRLCRLLLGDLQEADDVVQDVFLKAHEAERLGRVPANWGAWLTRVAVNGCRDRHRAGGWMRFRLRGVPLDEVPLEAQALSPGDAAISEDTRRRIWTAFRALPRRQQEVFALRHIEEEPTAAVAAALGLSPGSVKRHLFRAVRALRRSLGDAR
jgi:RNA polymerase sigma-70 factor (ECF subfamily)